MSINKIVNSVFDDVDFSLDSYKAYALSPTIVGLELQLLIAQAVRLPFELIAKMFVAPMNSFCPNLFGRTMNNGNEETEKVSRITIWNDSLHPLNTSREIILLMIGLASSIIFYLYPSTNMYVHSKIGLISSGG